MGSSIFVLGEGTSLTLERLQAQRFCDLSCNWWGDYQYVIKPSELQLTGRERDMLWDLEFGVKTPKTPLQQSFIMHHLVHVGARPMFIPYVDIHCDDLVNVALVSLRASRNIIWPSLGQRSLLYFRWDKIWLNGGLQRQYNRQSQYNHQGHCNVSGRGSTSYRHSSLFRIRGICPSTSVRKNYTMGLRISRMINKHDKPTNVLLTAQSRSLHKADHCTMYRQHLMFGIAAWRSAYFHHHLLCNRLWHLQLGMHSDGLTLMTQ